MPSDSSALARSSMKNLGLSRAVGLVVLAVLPACGDLDLSPPAELESDAPVATMRFSEGLPSLAGLAERWAPGPSLEPIVDQWVRGWEGGVVEGERRRLEAVRSAVPFLVEAMPEDAVDQTLDEVATAVSAVEEALGDSLPRGLHGPLERAGREHERARLARQAGDREGALASALLTADLLRSTTPEVLASAMIARGDEALRRISDDDAYPLVTRRRGERLLVGAREALETGDSSLALRRAWYALGLLEPNRDGRDDLVLPDSENPDR